MQLNVTGQNLDLTPALHDYVSAKFDRLKRHVDFLIDAHVILDVSKNIQHAEATVQTPGKPIFADAEASDMYAAIDALTVKLDRQLIKHKEKMKNHHNQTPPHKKMHLE